MVQKRRNIKREVQSIRPNNQKHDKFNIYIMIISLLTSWLSLTNILLITKYDILPVKFLIPVIIFFTLVPGLLIYFMIRKKTKIKIKKILSVICILLSIVFVVLLCYLNRTFKFLSNLGSTGYMRENYSVIVLKDSNYKDIMELKDKRIGYYTNETSNIEKALFKLNEKVVVSKIFQNDYTRLVESLYNQENDAIVIEESYRGIIEETDVDFSSKTRVLYTIEVDLKTEDVTKNVNVTKDSFNIYISGIDTYGSISSVSRSDVNIIATVNPKTHQILLTTIPRDYYVQLDGTTGYKDKLTHAGIYGVEKSVKTLENLLNIEINYYIKVNFSSLEKLVEALGGVDVYSEYTFTGTAGSSFVKGYNRVNGKQALEFARTRKTVVGGDRTRGQNQQALIQAIINKACSKEIITKYTSILNSLENNFQTNMNIDKMTDLIKKQIDEMKPWTITSISLDGSNGSEYTHSYQHQKLYVMIPDESTIENAKQKISQVENGETLESSYIENNSGVNIPTVNKPSPDVKKEEVKTEQKEEKPTDKEDVKTDKKEEIKTEEKEEVKEEKPTDKEDLKQENKEENSSEDKSDEKEENPTDKEEVKTEEKEENIEEKEEIKTEEKEEVKTEEKEEIKTEEKEEVKPTDKEENTEENTNNDEKIQ